MTAVSSSAVISETNAVGLTENSSVYVNWVFLRLIFRALLMKVECLLALYYLHYCLIYLLFNYLILFNLVTFKMCCV